MSGNRNYESFQARLDGNENAAANDTEMQRMTDSDAREGRDELANVERGANLYDQIPDAGKIQMLEAHANELRNNANKLELSLKAALDEYTNKVDVLHNELATLNQRRRRDLNVIGATFSVLGIFVVATGSVMGCYLGGLFNRASKPPVPIDPAQDTDASGATTIENADIVMEATLQEWVKLPNETLWSTIGKTAFKSKEEWSIRSWAYVTAYLDELMQRMASSGRMPNYSKLLVSDAIVNSDFTKWKDDEDLASRWVFDHSAGYETLDQDGVTDIEKRGVRMNYLAQMFKKASEVLDDDGI